jgi:hypothetical protein
LLKVVLHSSEFRKEHAVSTTRIAKEDITEVNDQGQTVVVVHAGQPIPEGVEVPDAGSKSKSKAKAE